MSNKKTANEEEDSSDNDNVLCLVSGEPLLPETAQAGSMTPAQHHICFTTKPYF